MGLREAKQVSNSWSGKNSPYSDLSRRWFRQVFTLNKILMVDPVISCNNFWHKYSVFCLESFKVMKFKCPTLMKLHRQLLRWPLINHDDSPHVSMQKINLNIQNPNTTLVLINIQILKQGNSLYTSVTVQEE